MFRYNVCWPKISSQSLKTCNGQVPWRRCSYRIRVQGFQQNSRSVLVVNWLSDLPLQTEPSNLVNMFYYKYLWIVLCWQWTIFVAGVWPGCLQQRAVSGCMALLLKKQHVQSVENLQDDALHPLLLHSLAKGMDKLFCRRNCTLTTSCERMQQKHLRIQLPAFRYKLLSIADRQRYRRSCRSKISKDVWRPDVPGSSSQPENVWWHWKSKVIPAWTGHSQFHPGSIYSIKCPHSNQVRWQLDNI